MALAIPKSITLGTGSPSCIVTRILEGLRSRWMIPFWCACCTAWQTCTISRQPLGDGQAVVVASSRDRVAAHQFHDEIRPAGRRGAGVEHLGEVGVLHHRERLPLGRESRHHFLGVHAEPHDLERDLPLHRFPLVRHEHHAAPAFPDFLRRSL